MANPVGKLGFKLLRIAIGLPVGIATRKLIERIWRAARPADPPRAPARGDVTWGDALGWAAVSAAGVAAAQLATYKGAATVWRGLTGSNPPPPKDKEKEKGLPS
ncbi:MAG TPA: DUF4235 domain-containing protein [Jatrophihabitantaceae bacterium]|jgi:hypothetical protein|nr:DUF4235 domain-containing protein [Jatrophihabitantaceae bacterium]